MSNGKHTPGPWTMVGGAHGEWDIEAVGDHDDSGGGAWAIAQTFGSVGYGEGNIESDANARLIAAAPDLLEALRPFIPAYRAYIETMQNFIVDGETLAERRDSESERRESASENAFEELAKVSFDQLAAAAKAIAKAEGRE